MTKDADVTPTETNDTSSSPRLGQRALRWAREALLFVAAALVLSTVVGRVRAPDLPDQAPELELVAISEGVGLDVRAQSVVKLSELRGKTVVVNFWATWCGPCRLEIPMLSSFAKSNPDVVVLGVAVDSPPDEVDRLLADGSIAYPVLKGTKKASAIYGVETLPQTVVIDAEGKVVATHVGLITNPQLWAMLP